MIPWLPNGLIEHTLPRPDNLIECDTVLDLGCGVRPITWYKAAHHVCVDAHKPYLDIVANAGGYHCLHSTALDAIRAVKAGSVGAIYCLDMIEHLTREDGHELVRLALMAQPRQIVIFTPVGFLKQEGPDPWGLGGEKWQEHRSGWTPVDFPGWSVSYYGRGFTVVWTNAESKLLAA